MKITMEFPKQYEMDLTNQILFGKIPLDHLYKTFSDGRFIGILADELMNSNFFFQEGKNTVCKVHKTNNVDLAPSFMKGVGRHFDANFCMDYLNKQDYWIFINISNFPRLYINTKTKDQVLSSCIVTEKSARYKIYNK